MHKGNGYSTVNMWLDYEIAKMSDTNENNDNNEIQTDWSDDGDE